MARYCAVAMLIPGMLGPGNTALQAELPALCAPTRELQFGWVDVEDEIPPPPGRVTAVRLAAYQTLE